MPLARLWQGLLLVAAVPVAGCGGGQAQARIPEGATQRDTSIEHEACAIDGNDVERIDADGDGRPDIFIVRSGGHEVCRAVDLNLDGVIDRWTYFDADGRPRRQESDYDRDGRIDEIALFRDGVVVERQRATSLVDRLDTWQFYEKGELVRVERDANGDGIIDQWWEYPSPECPLIHVDVNNDGRPDPGASIDSCKDLGHVPPVRQTDDRHPPSGLKAPVETVTEVESGPAEEAAEEDP